MSAILQLRLIAFRGLAPAAPQVFEFNQDEILIGRAPDNDFVVDDPERYCSRYHARCYRAENQFFVEDTSTPGTQVNAGHFLSKGQRHRLVNGDLLHIGECQIQVEIIQPAVAAPVADAGAFSIDDFFADGSSGFDAEPEANKVPLPNIPYTSAADFYNPVTPDFPAPAEPQSAQQPQPEFATPSDHGYASEAPCPELHGMDSFNDIAELPSGAVTYSEEYDISPDCSAPAPEPEYSAELQAGSAEPVVESGVPQQAPAAPPAASQPKSDADVDSRAIRAFLQGLNVEPSDLVGRNKEEIMYSAGQMLSILTQGIMEILLSRNDVKKEFGMDVTRIGAQMNNPLKFSQSSGEAMIKLLTEAEGYMSAHDAVKEGVVDAKAHQVAVMAGMQSAIVSMLERFRPEALEEQLTSRFVFSRKGKYWEAYKEAYRQLVSEAEDDFNALFGEEFSQVYQQQVREIESGYSQE
ncbi:MAG: type VI secretion system-associated FHA domain protein TagH [Amphritea sp.]|nr:type VI secretion system-associated FHA domain protein TagH [Amphritea sp.]